MGGGKHIKVGHRRTHSEIQFLCESVTTFFTTFHGEELDSLNQQFLDCIVRERSADDVEADKSSGYI